MRLLVLAVLALPAGAARAAATFYVSPSGNDSNPGTAALPWLTLQNAMNNLQAGDTVDVAAGDYAGFSDGFANAAVSGSAGAPITFDAAPGAVIDAPNPYTADGIDLEPGCNYLTIEGFTVQNPASDSISRAGIRVTGSNYVQVLNNNVNNCGDWGIFTGMANYILVQGNTASNSQVQHGIYISNACVGPVVSDNIVFGNHDCGIQFNGDLSQGGNGLITGGTVEGNVVYNNGTGGGSAINCDGLQSSLIENNLLYNNHATGIALFMSDAAAGSIDNQIVNNMVINAANGRNAIQISNSSTGNTLRNDMIFNENPSSEDGGIAVTSDSLPGLLSDNNIVDPRFIIDSTTDTLAQWQSATGNDTQSCAHVVQWRHDERGRHTRRSLGGIITNLGTPIALDKIGSGALVLSGTETYTGGTIVSDGTLIITDDSALPGDGSVTVGAGGTLIYDPTQQAAAQRRTSRRCPNRPAGADVARGRGSWCGGRSGEAREGEKRKRRRRSDL